MVGTQAAPFLHGLAPAAEWLKGQTAVGGPGTTSVLVPRPFWEQVPKAPPAQRSTLPGSRHLQSAATRPRPLQRLPQTHSWVTCACSLQGHRPEPRQARAPQARTEGHPAPLGRKDVQEMLKHAWGDLANFYIILFKENKLFSLQKGYTFIHVTQGRRIAQNPVSTGAGCVPAWAPCSPHHTSLLTEKTRGHGSPDSV